MTIDDLTDSYVKRLQDKIKGCQVEAFPDDPKLYRFIHPTAALLVRYGGSRYPESGIESTDSWVVQERYPMVEIRIVTRKLTGPTGAGSFLDQVRAVLTGFKAPDCQRAYVIEEDFDHYNDKQITWQHHILFEAQALNIEIPEEEQLPLLKRLTINSSTSDTLEVP